MNLAWIRGKLTEAEMREEHPLELERIRGQQLEEEFAGVEEEEIEVNLSEQLHEEQQPRK